MDTVRSDKGSEAKESYRNVTKKSDGKGLGHMRRLEIRLPVSHPIWSVPSGERTAYVRLALDFSMILSRQGEIEARLSRLESKVTRRTDPPTEPAGNGTGIDIGAFTDAILDL